MANATTYWRATGVNRTWTDHSGQHHLEAKFRGINQGIVTLEAIGGREVKVSVERLSSLDKSIVSVFDNANEADIATLASTSAN